MGDVDNKIVVDEVMVTGASDMHPRVETILLNDESPKDQDDVYVDGGR